MLVIACGNCLWNALYLRFPAISSLSFILVSSCVGLSCLRLFRPKSSGLIPPILILVPLLIATLILAPATFGPYLGLWIPVVFCLGIWSLIRNPDDRIARRFAIGIAAASLLASLVFGTLDYLAFYRIADDERKTLDPIWNHDP